MPLHLASLRAECHLRYGALVRKGSKSTGPKTRLRRVVCAVYWFQTGNGMPRLKAPSTSSRDVPSLTTSVGIPIKPS